MQQARRRVMSFALLMGLGLLGCALKLTLVAAGHTEQVRAGWERQASRRVPLPARRGELRDRHGRLLASSLDTLQLECLPRNLLGRRKSSGDKARLVKQVARFLAPRVRADALDLARRMTSNRYTRLGEAVSDPALIDELMAERRGLLYCLDFQPGVERRYPWGSVAGNLIGYVDHGQAGVAGLERGLQAELAGVDGARMVRVDPLGREIWEAGMPRLAPTPGRNQTLTLDVVMQQMVEQELARACAEQEASRGYAVVLDAATAEVLVLASVPGLDPDDPRDRPQAGSVIGAVQEIYAPGSTFKPLMLAGALELGLVQPDQRIDCRPERGHLPGRLIRDTHPRQEPLTLEEVLVHSSNIGMSSILMSIVPADTPRDTAAMAPVHELLGQLGFGRPTGVPLPAEAAGIVTPLERWVRHWTLASVSYGQEISVTALQMAAAVNTLTDGLWRRPHLLRSSGASDGSSLPAARPSDVRRVYSPDNARRVRGWMVSAVDQGECREVKLRGVSVAGKTGTADAEAHRGQEIHSYVALAPAQRPELTLVVVLAEPQHARYSSQSAAPAAGRMLRRLMTYLGHRVE